ncbi:hypothetical protein L218DRAFT_282668 [Marasmius fiardii PR-910]|nr:hypothetical protein L218DRAFT_282668 [Marasmius fiardii PR-910]
MVSVWALPWRVHLGLFLRLNLAVLGLFFRTLTIASSWLSSAYLRPGKPDTYAPSAQLQQLYPQHWNILPDLWVAFKLNTRNEKFPSVHSEKNRKNYCTQVLRYIKRQFTPTRFSISPSLRTKQLRGGDRRKV